MNDKELNLITFILMVAIAVTEIASDIYAPSLPVLVDYFGASEQTVTLSLSMALLGFCLSAPFYGPLSDSFGRRSVMIVGMLIFTVGSLLCALSPSATFLILARLIQGLGLAVAYVVGIAVVKDLYDEIKFAKIMSTIHMVVALAPAIAPIIGGYVTDYLGWQYNFLIIGAIAGVVGLWMRSMPETLPQKSRQPFSFTGMVQNYRLIISNPIFTGYALISSIIYTGLWIYISEAPFVLHHIGVEVTEFGYYQAVLVVAYALATYINSKTVESYGIDRLLFISLFISLTGALLLTIVAFCMPYSSIAICTAMAIFSAGMGGVFANAASRSMGVFPDMKGTTAAALSSIECFVPVVAMCVLGVFHDNTIMPAAIGILLAASGAFVIHTIVSRWVPTVKSTAYSG